jgi:hypothetical protein
MEPNKWVDFEEWKAHKKHYSRQEAIWYLWYLHGMKMIEIESKFKEDTKDLRLMLSATKDKPEIKYEWTIDGKPLNLD